jgi:hypothetical protein
VATLTLLLALLLSCTPGCVWLHRLIPGGSRGRGLLIAGYGLFLGMLGLTLVMKLHSVLGIPFSPTWLGLSLLGLLLAGSFIPAAPPREMATMHANTAISAPEKFLVAFCLGLIAIRLVTLGLEVTGRPIYAWDAKQHWAKQAKVFYEFGRVLPYVPLGEWLKPGGESAYTSMHPDYPITTPLLQVWTSLVLGRWHESLVGLPWLMCYMALGLVFAGQVRAAGASIPLVVATSYMVLSMPYLNIQVALAGYADLFLATAFLAAVAAFSNWSQGRETWQAGLAIVSALGCLLLKNEGFYWALSLLPGLALVWMGHRRGLLLLCVAFTGLCLVLWLLPGDLVIAGHSLDQAALAYRPKSWSAIYHSYFIHDNWHLLLYLLSALSVACLITRRDVLIGLSPSLVVMVAAMGLYLALYLLTANAGGAEHYTSLNRVALQQQPALAFVGALLYVGLVGQQKLQRR